MTEKTQKPLRIVSLQAENFKRLQAIEITPKGDVVTIAGRNGAGKSSTLDAIWVALAGAAVAPKVAIRKGAEQARIRVDLGEIVVTRTFKRTKESGEETTAVTVENAEGARFPGPQRMLDALLGKLSFDPLAFARMAPKEQFDTLRGFVPDFDFEASDNAIRADFQKRTDVNRRAKEARAVAASIALPADTPDKPIDTAALVDELQKAGEHNAQIEQRKARRDQVAADIQTAKRQAASLREQASDLRRRADALDADAAKEDQSAVDLQAKLDGAGALPDPIDVSAVRAKIAEAERINGLVATKQRQRAAINQAEKLEAESEGLTKAMDDRKLAKQKAIEAAKLPVDGITFGDGEILMNGVPFEQASDAEKIRASVRLAMAANPKLRVLRIREGAFLDDDSLALVAGMAREADYQVWLEVLKSDDKTAVIIEDGRVKPIPMQEAAE